MATCLATAWRLIGSAAASTGTLVLPSRSSACTIHRRVGSDSAANTGPTSSLKPLRTRSSTPGQAIHQPSGGYEGQSADIEIHAREILDLRGHVDAIYARHTGQTLERVHEDMERDRFFTAEQASEYGLIDRIISSHELQRVATGFGSREEIPAKP